MSNRPRLKISHRNLLSKNVVRLPARDDTELVEMLERPERRQKKTKAERRRIRRRHERRDGRS